MSTDPPSFRARLARRLLGGAPSAPTPMAPTARTDTAAMRTNAGMPVRVDVNAAGQAQSGSGILNALSGLGGVNDSGATARPNLHRQYLTVDEQVALMRSTIYRRLIEILPREATRKGWTLDDSTDDAHPLRSVMHRLEVWQRFREADVWGRALGEARLWIVCEDGAESLSEPLDPSTVTSVSALHVLDALDFSPRSWCSDPESPLFGLPELYDVHPRRLGWASKPSQPVHASRLLRFYGNALPPSRAGIRSTDGLASTLQAESMGQMWWDALRRMDQTSAAGARLAQELSVKVFGVTGLMAKQAGDQGGSPLAAVWSAIQQQLSVAKGVVLDNNSSVTWSGAKASGFGELSTDARLQLLLMSGYPETLLFGQAPSGLNTDGDSWQKNWHATVDAHQEERYRKNAEFLCRCLYAATLGEEPEHWTLRFNPLGELDPKTHAEIEEINARTDALRIDYGLVSPERVRRSRLGQDGYSFHLLPPNDEEQAAEGGASVADLSALIAQRLKGGGVATGEEGESTNETETVEEAVGEGEAATHADAADLPASWLRRTFEPPKGGQQAAAKALRWREEHPDEVTAMQAPDGSPGTGWATARALASGKVTGERLVKIAAWWARHGTQAATRRIAREHQGTPWKDNGYVASLGWGLEVTGRWATRMVEQAREAAEVSDGEIALARMRRDATDGHAWIGVPLPAEAMRLWEMARQAVEGHVGDLPALDNPPHITLLYLGKVEEGDWPELVAAAREALDDLHAETLLLGGEGAIGSFPPAEPGDDVPIYLRAHGWLLHEMHDRLLKRLAHLVTAKQYARFRGHATLGYAPLTDEERARLAELELPEDRCALARVEVHVGGRRLATIVLDGRNDEEAA